MVVIKQPSTYEEKLLVIYSEIGDRALERGVLVREYIKRYGRPKGPIRMQSLYNAVSKLRRKLNAM